MELTKVAFCHYGKESAWKYAISAYNACEALGAYRITTDALLKQKAANRLKYISGSEEIPEYEQDLMLPGDYLTVGESHVSISFLVNLNVKSFFQSARSAFDYASQLINEFFVTPKIELVDFDSLNRKKESITETGVRNWVDSIAVSEIYCYISDYNNETKHNSDMPIDERIDTESLNISAIIPYFTKKLPKNNSRPHDSRSLEDTMKEIHEYVSKEMKKLLDLVAGSLNGV